jgi:uncharacterized damage-inducible protein DinB
MTPDPNVFGTGQVDERADLLDALGKHRALLLRTVDGISDEQAAARPTASELCLGGIIKHLTRVETTWAEFIQRGPRPRKPAARAAHAASFRWEPDDAIADLVAGYEEAARTTDQLVTEVPSLDDSQPLPEAPWFEAGARWSARRVLLHVLSELSQHAGHADIIRESLDGQKTMG